MRKQTILTAVAAAAISAGTAATAQINAPDAQGYFERAQAMYRDKNYAGCSDQLRQLHKLNPQQPYSEAELYYLALSAMHAGYDEATALIADYLRLYPESPRRQEMLVAAADCLFAKGKYAEALEGYRKVNAGSLNTSLADDYTYRKSYCLLLLGDYDEAAQGFDSLRGSKEYSDASRFYSGYIAYMNHEYQRAKQLLSEVDTSKAPGNAADYYLSQIYFMDGEYAQALTAARRMLERNPVKEFTPEANRIAGESLYNMGQTDEALPYLWAYASECSDPLPSAMYILGVSEYERGDYAAAIKLLGKATKADNAMGQSAYLYLGQSYVKEGNINTALMAFENAFRKDYNRETSETAFYNYAVAKMDGGRVPFGNSVKLFEEFLSRYPNSRYAPEVQQFIITGYMTDNDYESALASIERMKSPTPAVLAAKQRALFVLGTREFNAGQTSSAARRFAAARDIRGGDASIRRQCDLWLGDCQYQSGQYAAAAKSYLAYLNNLPSNDANRALAYYNLGYARMGEERYTDALKDFRRAADLVPASETATRADIYNRIGDCLYYQSQFTAAADNYRQAYDINPTAGDYALYQLAIMKGLSRDHKGKIAGIDELISQFPTSGLIPEALLEKAESYAALGDNRNAIITYTELVEKYPSSAYGRNGYLQLAITHINAGDHQAGIDAYKKVISTYPTSEEAKVASDDLKRIYADDGRLDEFARFINSVPNAPRIEASEIDALAFQAAEKEYITSQATAKLERYLAEYPHGAYEAQALYYLAQAASEAGDTDTAYRYASTLAENHPDAEGIEDVLLIKAKAETEQGKGETALRTYRALEQRASGARNLQEARMGIMRTAKDLGDDRQVLEVTGKLLVTSAAGSAELNEIKLNRAIALSRTGNSAEAESLWSDLAENADDVFAAQSAVYLAQSQLQRGDTESARRTIDTFINSNPPHQYWLARGFIVLSDVLRRQGETFEADEYLKSLKANYPGKETDIMQMIDERLTNQE